MDESRERQLIDAALVCVEARLYAGTATAEETTNLLRNLPEVDERYRVSLSYRLAWVASVHGAGMFDYCPPLRAWGFTANQALRRAVLKADGHNRPRREIRLEGEL